MIDPYDIKYCRIEGLPREEIYMNYCSRCTGKQYKECEFSSYSICKYKEDNKIINCDICKKNIESEEQ